MVNEEARELSVKLQNIIYVIQRGNTLYTTLIKNGKVISKWDSGNNIN